MNFIEISIIVYVVFETEKLSSILHILKLSQDGLPSSMKQLEIIFFIIFNNIQMYFEKITKTNNNIVNLFFMHLMMA